MSRLICSILLLLLVAACKNNHEDSATMPMPDYFSNEVGINNNGTFTVANIKAVQPLWENYVKQVLRTPQSVNLQDFKIVNTEALGDNPSSSHYMLVSRTTDGVTMAAALLELKDDKFYFLKEDKNALSYPVLVCSGECASGCDPVLIEADGKPLLNCSECVDCNKVVGEIGE